MNKTCARCQAAKATTRLVEVNSDTKLEIDLCGACAEAHRVHPMVERPMPHALGEALPPQARDAAAAFGRFWRRVVTDQLDELDDPGTDRQS